MCLNHSLCRNKEIFTDQVAARLKLKYSQKSEETVPTSILQLENTGLEGLRNEKKRGGLRNL